MDLLVVGLGNPGARYEETRHNAGFRVVESVAASAGVRFRKRLCEPLRQTMVEADGGRLCLAEPLTYMNRSGEPLPALLRRLRLGWEAVLVICDSMDIPVGQLRLRVRGGTAGHGGLKSILQASGTEMVARLYVGVGRPKTGDSVVDHVLGIPDPEEAEALREAETRAVVSILSLPVLGFEAAMNDVNRRA